jgi:hypothetical protein
MTERALVPREAVVAEDLEWLDTPFHPQAHVKGIGCDCAGLVRGVMIALALAGPDPRQWPGAERYAGYRQRADGDSMRVACDAFLIRVREPFAGGAALYRWKDDRPQHLGMVVPHTYGRLALVHALGPGKPGKVVLSPVLPTMVLVQAYALPGVA